ncbi:S8 family serine peptidase [Bacillus sp. FJAT-29790]|uniref:S8 family peptidase n=1 Tax=Bacillus sp. FJAT-29790 TaxID=1895002 RepID=UPI001C22AC71|nr:S8 family serine peptidase [Bacillus sp. FJAT-29790]MBU8881114.1 S8 family serine peptidase [Bacillus sp. FJAT-29790]
MIKKLLALLLTTLLVFESSLFNVTQVFAEYPDNSSEKKVIAENTTNTNEAIEQLSKKLQDNIKIRVIVGIKDGSQMPDGITSSRAIESVQRKLIRELDQVMELSESEVKKFKTIPFAVLTVNREGFESLLQNPNVVSVEEDVPTPLLMAESNGVIGSNIAWDIGFTGKGQTVAVLDTGVDKNHPFLKGKIVSEACYSTNESIYGSKTLCPDGKEKSIATGSGMDCNKSFEGCGHGTHVSGTVAGKETPYLGKKLSGVAKDANIIAIQVFSKFPKWGGGYEVLSWSSDQILALERVFLLKNQYNIASVNMSLGGGSYSTNCDEQESGFFGRKLIINKLTQEGIAVVIASGNDGFKDSISAPACISSAVSVGATSKSDEVAWFSNSSKDLDLLAPGMSITSSVPGSKYDSWDGTSMATPHVAGAWAVLKEMKPDATVNEVLTFLQSTGKPVTDYNEITKSRIDLSKIGEFTQVVVSLSADPSEVVLSQGKTRQLKITANYSDNTDQDVTNEVIYTSSDTKRAVISKEGLITIPANATNGTVAITAKLGNRSVVIPVKVEQEIREIKLNQSSILLESGKTIYFKLTANYSDGKIVDVTRLAKFDIIKDGNESEQPKSVKEHFTTINGTLKALSTAEKGTYTLIAKYQNKETSSELEYKPVLTKITADTQKPVLNPGNKQPLKITVHFSDGSEENITTKATYTSSNTRLANIAEVVVEGEQAKEFMIDIPENASKGTAKITVKYGGLSAVISVTVEPELYEIKLNQSNIHLELGRTASYNLTATYSDRTSKDITRLAEYEIKNASGETIADQITLSNGILRTLNTAEKGTYTIIAKYQNKVVSAELEVKPVLTKITAESQKLVLNPGKIHQLKITAHYSDSSTEVITTQATYTSNNVKRGTVNESGLITILADAIKGTVDFTAKYGSRTVVVSVTIEPELTEIELGQSNILIELGSNARYKLTATYKDGTSKDITRLANYEIKNASGKTITNQITATNGTLKALATAEKGTYTFIAKYQDKEVTAELEVKPVLTKITTESQKITLKPSSTQQLDITAHYSDGSTKVATSQATYTSGNVKRAIVSADGLITVPAEATRGTVNITVKYGNRSVVIYVTVTP